MSCVGEVLFWSAATHNNKFLTKRKEKKMEDVKKRIAPVLRNMRIGEKVSYPRQRLQSLYITISRLQYIEEGMRWSVRRLDSCVEVTRTA